MDGFYRTIIELLKERIAFGRASEKEASALLRELGKEIDRCKVYGKSNAELERLYKDVLWLKCETIK